jgi:hypothetical protein
MTARGATWLAAGLIRTGSCSRRCLTLLAGRARLSRLADVTFCPWPR